MYTADYTKNAVCCLNISKSSTDISLRSFKAQRSANNTEIMVNSAIMMSVEWVVIFFAMAPTSKYPDDKA